MPRHASLLLFLALGATLAGCSSQRVAFLHSFREPGRLDGDALKKLQFYLSEDVVLRRSVDTSEHLVTREHTYRSVDGELVESVEIPAGTPGLVVGAKGDLLLVSFEEEGSLPFQHLPKMSGHSNETYRFPYRNGKLVKYRGHTYKVIAGGLSSTEEAMLLVEAEWGSKYEREKRTVGGRTLAGR
jgi:hypothetical protein